MDLKNILHQIEQADPEVYEKISPRRHVLQSFGSKVALAALPLALGSLFNKAYGKTTDVVVDTLNFALQLEYLEYNFYYAGVNTAGLIASADAGSFTKIMTHEKSHVDFLKTTIMALGGTPYVPAHYTATANVDVTPASFDFTAGGSFPAVFSNYDIFLAVSQTFEDTGVRAYKGQAGYLQGTANHPYLLAALQIHSAEARHAAYVRYLRMTRGSSDKPWITGNTPPVPAVAGNYAGEENTLQLTVNVTTLPGASGTVSTNAASEAFDEPLTKAQVVTLVTPFFKP